LWAEGQKPQTVNFFKVKGEGYNTAKRKLIIHTLKGKCSLTAVIGLWANEIIIADGNRDHIKIPSDIKPGLYILRSELLSLHGNGQTMNPGLKGLPQFYVHCFNIEITGSGTATPSGVRFPGGYPKNDPGVGFILGNQARYSSYVSSPIAYFRGGI
jgi:hypothetical protein